MRASKRGRDDYENGDMDFMTKGYLMSAGQLDLEA